MSVGNPAITFDQTILHLMLTDRARELVSLTSLSKVILKQEFENKHSEWCSALIKAFVCKNFELFGNDIFSVLKNVQNDALESKYQSFYSELKSHMKSQYEQVNSMVNQVNELVKKKEKNWTAMDFLKGTTWDLSVEIIAIFRMFLLSLRMLNSFCQNENVINELKDISNEIQTVLLLWKTAGSDEVNTSPVCDGVNVTSISEQEKENGEVGSDDGSRSFINEEDDSTTTSSDELGDEEMANLFNGLSTDEPEEMFTCDICEAQFINCLTYDISYSIHEQTEEHIKCVQKSDSSKQPQNIQPLGEIFNCKKYVNNCESSSGSKGGECSTNKATSSKYTRDYLKKLDDTMYKCTLCKVELHMRNIDSHIKGSRHKNYIKMLNGDNASVSSQLPVEKESDFILKAAGPHCCFMEKAFKDDWFCMLCERHMSESSVSQHVRGGRHLDYCKFDIPRLGRNNRRNNQSTSGKTGVCYRCNKSVNNFFHIQTCEKLKQLSETYRESKLLPSEIVKHHKYIIGCRDKTFLCWLCSRSVSTSAEVVQHVTSSKHMERYKTVCST